MNAAVAYAKLLRLSRLDSLVILMAIGALSVGVFSPILLIVFPILCYILFVSLLWKKTIWTLDVNE